MDRVAELIHTDAINNAKFSPNGTLITSLTVCIMFDILGKRLCAVGDNNMVYLYSIDENIPLSDGNEEHRRSDLILTPHIYDT